MTAQSTFNLKAAYQALAQISTDTYKGSGIVISVSALDGRELMPSFAINDESLELPVQALRRAIAETLEMRRTLVERELRDIDEITNAMLNPDHHSNKE